MAQRLSKVYGTEMDKVNCPFFYKIGACRYGDSCERIHNKPPISQTVLLEHMYENSPIQTALISGNPVAPQDAQKALQKFQTFYEDVFKQMSQFGEIQDMIVVDNLGDHLAGNVYVKYSDEDYAQNAQSKINGRFFAGKKINAVFSPVTDFTNAKCKQHIDGSCKRGGYCNYMHVKPLSKSFQRQLFAEMYIQYPQYKEKKRDESNEDEFRKFQRRNKGRGQRDNRNRDRQRQRERQRDYDRDRRDRRDRDRDRRSRSKDRNRKDQRKKDRRDRSQSRDSSLQRKFMIQQWNQDYYKK